MTSSVLDDVPGLGPNRRARLLREVGSVATLRTATPEALRALSWLPDTVADAVYAQLHDPSLGADDVAGRASSA
jgi:excinuclease ABC subunit C